MDLSSDEADYLRLVSIKHHYRKERGLSMKAPIANYKKLSVSRGYWMKAVPDTLQLSERAAAVSLLITPGCEGGWGARATVAVPIMPGAPLPGPRCSRIRGVVKPRSLELPNQDMTLCLSPKPEGVWPHSLGYMATTLPIGSIVTSCDRFWLTIGVECARNC